MAHTLEELRTMRAELFTAIASGAYLVRHGDKQVMYQTTAAMREALAQIDAEITALVADGAPRPRRYRAGVAGKGL